MTIPCSYCGADAREIFVAKDLNQMLSGEEFEYFRCRSCALIFLAPIPENLGAYYVPSYSAYRIPSMDDLSERAETERYKLAIIRRLRDTGRLLEIGPGFGAFAHLAKQGGFEVEAVEMDERCSEFLKGTLGIRTVVTDRVSSAVPQLGRYDVVTLWHVLEHLPDAWESLRALASRLDEGGFLVITTPNPDSVQFSVFGRYWTHLDAPRHVQLIPSKLLVDHAHSLGLELRLAHHAG